MNELTPKIGEIKRSFELGRRGYAYRRWIWAACIECGKERWSILKHGTAQSLRCCKCANHPRRGKNHPNWKGGISKNGHGYIIVMLQLGDFFYPMADSRGRVMEHRLVMAKHLNRCLLPWELVHHKGTRYSSDSIENRSDNRLENLQLLPNRLYHVTDSRTKHYLHRLEKRIASLTTENLLLKEQFERLEGK